MSKKDCSRPNAAITKQTALLLLASLHSVLFVGGSILGVKVVRLGPLNMLAGFFSASLIFLLVNVITNNYGKTLARTVVTVSVVVRAFFFLVCVPIALALPTALEPVGYQKMLVQGFRLFLAGEAAAWISQFFVDIPVFSRLRQWTGFGTSYLGTTLITRPVSATIFCLLAFSGTSVNIWRLLAGMLIVAISSCVLLTPLAVGVNKLVARCS